MRLGVINGRCARAGPVIGTEVEFWVVRRCFRSSRMKMLMRSIRWSIMKDLRLSQSVDEIAVWNKDRFVIIHLY